ncbi:MAG: hypothetical protein PHX80_04585 [Candidatus Nanoarchaeia archaeon]|nr:hypothetical protein [Candidatus Nanoarchaeia archaeon]
MSRAQIEEKIKYWERIKEKSTAPSEISFCENKITSLTTQLENLDVKSDKAKKPKKKSPPLVLNNDVDVDFTTNKKEVEKKKKPSLLDGIADLI